MKRNPVIVGKPNVRSKQTFRHGVKSNLVVIAIVAVCFLVWGI